MYYVSSAGYENNDYVQLIKDQRIDDREIKFLEYKDKIYFEPKFLR